jgi:hypothetical protein
MVVLCRQRKETFIGDIGKLSINQIPRRGVLILTKKVLYHELFNYSGMHSLLEVVAMGILYGLKCLQIHAQTVHDTNRLRHC